MALMIETDGLKRTFKDLVAVRDLSLKIEEGEVFGFLGPNGAGKTTTVRMLAGLIAPSAGRACVAGLKVGRDNHRIRRRVGVLTETPGLYEKLSAWRNLEFFARLYGVEDMDIKAQIEKYLDLLDLWDRRHDPVGEFSKGMRQKVAIARALLHEPPVVFLDEPTAGLDPEAAVTVRAFIAELSASERRTVVLCTHNLHEAEQLCDRIGLMKQTLIRVGTAEQLKRELYEPQTIIQLQEMLPDPDLQEALDLPFIKALEVDGNRLAVTLSDPEAQNPLLVQRLVERGAKVQYVREREYTLEDVYLDLMGEVPPEGT